MTRTSASAPLISSTTIGSTIGLVGGTVFVLANRSALPGHWSTAALVAWLVALAAAVYSTYVLRVERRPDAAPSRWAGPIYLGSCLAMIALIAAGSAVLRARGQGDAVPALIALAVGLHFIPFSRAFGLDFFTRLGIALSTIGAVGLVLALTWTLTAAATAAVLAGLVMTAMIAAGAVTAPRTAGAVTAADSR